MSDRRPPKRSFITVHQEDDGTWTLTAYAPRDGAGRQTSAADLHYKLSTAELRSLSNGIVMALAGAQ
jgi:hypothetical protein